VPRVIIVANRLPVTVSPTESGVEVQKSTGGLATGLLRPHEQSGGVWIGWTGSTEEDLSEQQRKELGQKLSEMRLVAVPLTGAQVARYYEGYSNGVLWPLFHYLLDQIPLQVRDWDAYLEVNEQFADAVAQHYQPGDLIWVHDYQLLLLPQLLRRRLPNARIGFFLHIPFPSEELFRTLPERDRVLRGLLGADLVGSPTLGPVAFMHRDSARDNPQVPLTHHFLDSTHITTGVLRGGVDTGDLTFEASVFRGEEPNENRLNIDAPRLDSWAARVQYNAGPWHAQFSGGRLHEPAWFDPLDVTLLTASIEFDGQIGARPLSVLTAWGGHRENNGFNGNADGYLVEGEFVVTPRSTLYGRAEYVGKDLFVDVHPKGFGHRSVIYQIGAITAGFLRDFSVTRAGRVGVGADVTVYHMQDDLRIYWASSRSFHVFLRWRPVGVAPHTHM